MLISWPKSLVVAYVLLVVPQDIVVSTGNGCCAASCLSGLLKPGGTGNGKAYKDSSEVVPTNQVHDVIGGKETAVLLCVTVQSLFYLPDRT